MLSLGRTPGQYIVIDGNIVIQVVSVDGSLRLAIDAPREISIERGENYEKAHPVPTCISQKRPKQKRRGTDEPAGNKLDMAAAMRRQE